MKNDIANHKDSSLSSDIHIDNSHHVLLKIATLYADRLMNDITLVVNGTDYPAHRLILCASSDVFQVMLMNPLWSESHESRVVLKETPLCATIFGEFLKYFYSGHIRINHKIIMPILELADKYNVKDLVNLCTEYMCSHIGHAAINNQLVTWFQCTLTRGHQKVAYACQNFLKWNFELVAKMADFNNCFHETLTMLLQQNDIVVTDEMTLYKYVVSWLEFQESELRKHSVEDDQIEGYMKNLVHEVMSYIRFPMMSPRQLAELLLSPLITKYKEFFIERMAIGMSFHSDQKERVNEVAKEESGRLLFTPRLYTSEMWCSRLLVDNFKSLPHYLASTLCFSSHSSLAEYLSDRTCEWVIDLYPKGVWFQKSLLIVWQGTMELPEVVLPTVRLAITCKNPVEGQVLRTKIGILVTGVTDGVEHTAHVVERNYHFTEENQRLNLDQILPYDELNTSLLTCHAKSSPSSYLVGPFRDTLKLYIVITPMSDVSSTLT